MFPVYLELGFDHILDLQGYDHILFLIALCAIFSPKDWKKVLILVTAFTLGHSLTLALSALQIITLPAGLIETLIPVTILITAVMNLFQDARSRSSWVLHYALALVFGFIHGMGFSNFFKALLGQEAEIILPLFAFNIGVELGQLIIVGVILVLQRIVVGVLKVPQRYWVSGLSIVAASLSIKMIIERL